MDQQPHHWIAFYQHQADDHRARSLIDIWTMTFDELERQHDFIQWLFPLPEPSPINPDAPLLTNEMVLQAMASEEVQQNLLRSFDTMAAFWGFCRDDDLQIKPSAHFTHQVSKWCCDHNHNQLRITRMLRCLTLCGQHGIAANTCQFLLNAIDQQGMSLSQVSAVPHWIDAISNEEPEELTLDDFELPDGSH
ncbi:opioid growth factor receptor-related protein [Pleionea litopenaei]|uniref:Opioid growth factor receptor-related protein n=1 Tax=Pleionea litopenaei TaxID=3070815 RepID=A0AA51RTH3_9GAMM|nr:opioid growth factor receptor-related protein [Pleionea sp. HL-JVS1]WMS87193.1 opioid growth factor receptor-related protein [Pleionea sp. HL-JVS1]